VTRLPTVISLVLCDAMRVDPQRGKTALDGLFHARFVQVFPSQPQAFTTYIALNGGEGEGIMRLIISRLETEQDVYSYKKWCVLPGPGQVSDIEIKVTTCRFPAPGRYRISLQLDGTEVAHRLLDVFKD